MTDQKEQKNLMKNTSNDKNEISNLNNLNCLKNVYKNVSYKMYVKNTYKIDNEAILTDDNIILSIFCCEWFKIDKRDILNKIRFNPKITIQDFTKVDLIVKNYKFNLMIFHTVIFGVLFFMFKPYSGRLGNKLFKYAGCLSVSLSFTFIFSKFYRRKLYNLLEKDDTLKQYLNFDFDEAKINDELLNYGIKIHKTRFLI